MTRSASYPSRSISRICSIALAPFAIHRIYLFFANRSPITKSTSDSARLDDTSKRLGERAPSSISTIVNRATSLCQVLDAFLQSPLRVYLRSLATLREPARCSPQLDRTTAAVLSTHFFSCALYLCLALNGGCRESIGGRVQIASLCETNRKFDAPGAKTDRLDMRRRRPPITSNRQW